MLFYVNKQEVLNKMADFWNEESAREIHEYNLMKEARKKGIEEGREEGREEGKAEGIAEGIKKLAETLKKMNHSVEEIKEQLKVNYHLTDKETEKYI